MNPVEKFFDELFKDLQKYHDDNCPDCNECKEPAKECDIGIEEEQEEITKEAEVIKQLMDENIKLHKANKQIIEAYTTSQIENNNMQKSLESITGSYDKVKQKLEKAKIDISCLNGQRTELLNRNNQLVEEINEKYSQPINNELEKENTKLKNKLNLIYNNVSKIVNNV